MKVGLGLIHTFWRVVGMRRVGAIMKQVYPSAYGETIFSFGRHDDQKENTTSNNDNAGNNSNGLVALTIDDGLVRRRSSLEDDDAGSSSCSMVQDVCDLLATYNAHATFFVCTKYTKREDAMMLQKAGHDFGNHLEEDLSGHYFRLSKDEFRNCLLDCDKFLRDECGIIPQQGQPKIKWFRAPQGVMTKSMNEVLKEEGIMNVLGDCYVDDWAFAEAGNTDRVAPLMLKQVRPGSIAIFHMPQHGFREGCLNAIKEFLDGLQKRGMRCVSLNEIEQYYSTTEN